MAPKSRCQAFGSLTNTKENIQLHTNTQCTAAAYRFLRFDSLNTNQNLVFVIVLVEKMPNTHT